MTFVDCNVWKCLIEISQLDVNTWAFDDYMLMQPLECVYCINTNLEGLFALCWSLSDCWKIPDSVAIVLTLGCFRWICRAQISAKPLIPSIPRGSSSAWNHICRLGINIVASLCCDAATVKEPHHCYATGKNSSALLPELHFSSSVFKHRTGTECLQTLHLPGRISDTLLLSWGVFCGRCWHREDCENGQLPLVFSSFHYRTEHAHSVVWWWSMSQRRYLLTWEEQRGRHECMTNILNTTEPL